MSHLVKPGITRAEHNEYALPRAADIELTLREVCVGPLAVIPLRVRSRVARGNWMMLAVLDD
jgi:hypothetical protein